MELMNASSSCASAIDQGGGGSASTTGSVPSAGGSGAIGSSTGAWAGAARGATGAGPGGTVAGTAWATACIGSEAATVARAINRKRLNIITSGIPVSGGCYARLPALHMPCRHHTRDEQASPVAMRLAKPADCTTNQSLSNDDHGRNRVEWRRAVQGRTARSGWISRALRRLFDEREEQRAGGGEQSAVLTHGGREHVVRVSNISPSGAMVAFAESPRVGDAVTLRLLDHGAVAGQVRWVRGGHVG